MNRRGFLATSLAACAAPAFVKSESLMGLWVPRDRFVFTSEMMADVSNKMLELICEKFMVVHNNILEDNYGISYRDSISEITQIALNRHGRSAEDFKVVGGELILVGEVL